MKLERLHIVQLPGIREGFALDELDPGFNLVSGPNASGKSSLLRALEYLLLPPASGDPVRLVLEAAFSDRQGRWEVSRNADRVDWRLNGERAERPSRLPDADNLQNYMLRVDTLLSRAHSDQRITRYFREELAGGYDLPGIRDALHVPRGRDRNAASNLRNAEDALRKADVANRQLLAQRQELPRLDEEIETARRARARADYCRRALEWLDLETQHREVKASLASFPETMPGDDTEEHWQALRKRLAEHQRVLDNAEQQLEAARQRLNATGLSGEDPETLDLPGARQQLDELRRMRSRLGELKEKHGGARARLREVGQALGANEDADLFIPSRELADEVERKAGRVFSARERLDEQRQSTQAANSGVERSRAPDGVAFLAGVAGTLALAGAALPSNVLVAVSAAVVVLGALGWSARHLVAGKGGAGRDAARREFERRQQELETARRALRETAQRAGIEVERIEEAGSVQMFVQQLLRREEARADEAALRKQCEELEARLEQSFRKLSGYFRQWNGADIADEDEAGSELARLERRVNEARESRQALRDATERRNSARGEVERAGTELDALYTRLALEPGDEQTLKERLALLPRYRELHEQARDLELRGNDARARLEGAEDEILDMAHREDHAALQACLEHSARAEATEQTRLEERESIRAAIRHAEQSHDLEEAMAGYEQAREALAEQYETQMLSAAGLFLLDDVEQEHHQEHQPETLRVADGHLRAFTHEQFRIRLDSNDGEIRAVDTRAEQERSLEELSVGTRMQLLIALRVAWAERLESGEPLPLFLDEALTTTDPERFTAVARALATEAASTGRQIFYLTAQTEDLERWRRATDGTPHHVDLARVRNLASAATEPLRLPEAEPLPDPREMPPEQWAEQAGVPPVKPLDGAAGLHLFHLLRDRPEWLHQLVIELRLQTLGQLYSFLEGRSAGRFFDDRQRRSLARRADIAAAWVEAWCRGRGRPVDRGVLKEAPAVSDAFLEAATEYAAGVGGEARALVQGLKEGGVKRFRDYKAEELEAWLEEQGYLDPRDRLDEDERFRHALEAAGPEADPEEVRILVSALEAATLQ